MNLTAISLGLVLTGMGVFAIKFPMRIRNYVSPKTWETDPETAKLYQRLWAYGIGVTVIVLGLFGIGLGLVGG